MKRMKALVKYAPKFLKSKAVVTTMSTVLLVAAMSVSAFAADSSYSSMGEALGQGVTDLVGETITSTISILPAILPLLGISILVAYVVKFIKKIAG